jgi:hypothetical protein
MSQATPCGLLTPRWSVAWQPAPEVGTWSSAALPGWSGLGNAYRKLGLAGRDQLAPALAVDLSPHPTL